MPPNRECRCGGTGWDGCTPDEVAADVSVARQNVAIRQHLASDQASQPSLTDRLLFEVQDGQLRRLLSTSPEPASVSRPPQPHLLHEATSPAALLLASLSLTDLVTQHPTSERKQP
jgi:hypothetical protein